MEECLSVSQDRVQVQCPREVVYVLGKEGFSVWHEDTRVFVVFSI